MPTSIRGRVRSIRRHLQRDHNQRLVYSIRKRAFCIWTVLLAPDGTPTYRLRVSFSESITSGEILEICLFTLDIFPYGNI